MTQCGCMRCKCSVLVLITWIVGASLLLYHCISGSLSIKLNDIVDIQFNNIKYGLIDTAGCKIPSLTLYDAVSTRALNMSVTTCAKINHLVERNATHMWKVEENEKYYYNFTKDKVRLEVNCYYKSFYRPRKFENINLKRKVDDRVKYGARILFNMTKPSKEFIAVECQIGNSSYIIYKNFYLFAQKKKFISHENAFEIPENNSLYYYNVLIIGLDSVSRLNLHRALPKTVDYLKQLDAIELLGYNKIGDDTFSNAVAILLGITENDMKHTCYPHSGAYFDYCPFVWEWYRQKGYFTAFGEDMKNGIFNYYKYRGFMDKPTDYYTHTFVYESAAHNNITVWQRCQNGQHPHQIMLNYIVDLTTVLNAKRLFGFFWESLISHHYLKDAKSLETDYFNLFKRLNDSGYLNKSIVFFISDHGMRTGQYAHTPQGRMESRLPFVFILTPQSFRSKYKEAYKNLMINSKRLTTPLDLHETLMDLMTLKSITDSEIKTRSNELNNGNKKGMTMFLPIPETRTCSSAGIEDTWCSCHNGKSLPVTEIKVLVAAEFMIKHLNEMLLTHYKCADLEISKVIDALEIVTVYNSTDKLIRLVIEAKPGGGIFEGTLRRDDNKLWVIAGPINRLNLPGEQGFCVEDYHLKLYCYCDKAAEEEPQAEVT